jgi:hypothetical protein
MFSVCGRQYQAETLRTILALVSLISLIAISGHAQSDSGYSLSLSSVGQYKKDIQQAKKIGLDYPT